MRVIVAGSRHLCDYAAVCPAMDEAAALGIVPTEIVSGAARGADALGERWGREHGLPVITFAACWQEYGLRAGPRRNEEMARYAQALVALPIGESKGTWDMIRRALAHGLRVHVYGITP